MKISNRLFELLDDMANDPKTQNLCEALMMLHDLVSNKLDIETVDISHKDWHFNVYLGKSGRGTTIKVSKFIKHFFEDNFSDKTIFDFVETYNSMKNTSKANKPTVKKVEIPEYSFNPKDIRSTFISLTTKTYPHGHEDEVVKFLPKGLSKDEYGNYFKIIGKSETMFTSHLDTADRKQTNVNLYSDVVNGDEIFFTDGSSILGADDKSGVSIMMYMMAHNIPGIYYFFIGEERGGIGSYQVADNFENFDTLKNVKRCVSFDRRDYFSVITHQFGNRCCSDQFATKLAEELNKSGLKISLDATGIYTDSASFIDIIPECTNLSVGYFSEHTGKEKQNITFLVKLGEACLKVNWEGLPTTKSSSINEEVFKKHKLLIKEVKSSPFNLTVKVKGYDYKVYIVMELEDPDAFVVYEDLELMNFILGKHGVNSDVIFKDNLLKIELT